MNSIRKYPLPLSSGKECVILEGFGDKICKLIDDKLTRFLKDGGVLHENNSSSDESSCEEVVSRPAAKTTSRPVTSSVCDNDDDDDDLVAVEKQYASSKVLATKSTNSIFKLGGKNKAAQDDDHEAKSRFVILFILHFVTFNDLNYLFNRLTRGGINEIRLFRFFYFC